MSVLVNSANFHNKNLRMLCFSSWEDFLQRPFFPDDQDLRDFPYQIGPVSIIVPVEAVLVLQARSLKFDILEPVTESDLTPQQDRALKSNKAILYRCGEVVFFMERSRYLHKKRGPS